MVISFICNGCIFKLSDNADNELLKVSYSIGAGKPTECFELPKSTDENNPSSPSYKIKRLDETTVLLKVENLKAKMNYTITVETGIGSHSKNVTISNGKIISFAVTIS